MDCSFCSVTAFNGRLFRMREVDDVVAEVAAITERDIIFVDDDLNGFSRKAKQRCLDLFRAMAEARLDKQWITQVTINFGDDDELPRLARAAGCAGVFIGLESTDTKSLALIRKDGMSQRRGLDYYRENVARIRRHGIGVVGSFILGIDTQNMDTIVGRHPAVRGGSGSRRPQPDDSDAAARHARLHALRRRGTHPVQELSGRLGEIHARLPRHEHAARVGRGADATILSRCCSFSGPSTSPRATGGRAKRSRRKRRGTRSCGTACGRTTACNAASSGMHRSPRPTQPRSRATCRSDPTLISTPLRGPCETIRQRRRCGRAKHLARADRDPIRDMVSAGHVIVDVRSAAFRRTVIRVPLADRDART